MKYNITSNIGKAKHVVNFHDGDKNHDDGSPFYDIRIFTSKRKMGLFVSQLRKAGYTEE